MNLIERIRRTEREIVNKTGELVSIPTPVPPGDNYKEAADWLSTFLKECDADVRIMRAPHNLTKTVEAELNGPRLNVIGEYDLGEGPSIIVAGHYDVVPVEESKWNTPPYRQVEKDGRLFGRGTADQKGSLISAIISIRELLQNEREALSGKIIVAATPDEEVGGRAGFGWLIKEKKISADECLITDGGIETLVIAANGTLRMRLKTYGKSGHSSRPWQAKNAIHDMIPVMSSLLKLSEKVEKRVSQVKYKSRGEVSNIRPSLNLDVIHAGVKANIIPDECTLLLDRRVAPDENAKRAEKEIMTVINEEKKQNPELDLTVEQSMLHTNFVNPSDFRFIGNLKEVYPKITGVEPFIGGTTGALDACYSVQEGIPTVTFGAARPDSNSHGSNESVLVDDLVRYAQIVSLSLREYLTNH
jgi:succinyl-diaminopimelate desuccinylase